MTPYFVAEEYPSPRRRVGVALLGLVVSTVAALLIALAILRLGGSVPASRSHAVAVFEPLILGRTIELIAASFVVLAAAGFAYAIVRRPLIARLGDLGAAVSECVPFFVLALLAQSVGARAGYFGGVGHVDNVWDVAWPACVLAALQMPAVVEVINSNSAGGTVKLSLGPAFRDLLSRFAEHLPDVIAGTIIVELFFARAGIGSQYFRWLRAPREAAGALAWLLFACALVVLVVRFLAESLRVAKSAVTVVPPPKPTRIWPVVVGLVVAGAVLAGVRGIPSAYSIDQAHWTGVPAPPCFFDTRACGGHVLGTDTAGRDLLSRLLAGAWPTLGSSFIAATGSIVLGCALGAVARLRPSVGFITLRLASAVSSFPAWPLVVFVAFLLGTTMRHRVPDAAILATAAVLCAPLGARHVACAKSWRDTGSIAIGDFIRTWIQVLFLLATVDFFGAGVGPETPTWGNMLTSAGASLDFAPWLLPFPALCLIMSALTLRALSVWLVVRRDSRA